MRDGEGLDEIIDMRKERRIVYEVGVEDHLVSMAFSIALIDF